MTKDSIPLAASAPRVITCGSMPERVLPAFKGTDVRLMFFGDDMAEPMLWRSAACRAIEAGAVCVRVRLPNGYEAVPR